MKKLFTAENRLFVFNIKNLLLAEGIETELKNEFAGGGIGDLAPLDTWLELWVEDENFSSSQTILQSILNELEVLTENTHQCPSCEEISEGHFKLCWHCGASLH